MAQANICVDMIVQTDAADKQSTDITFTLPELDLPKAREILENMKDELGFTTLVSDTDIVKVSLVGVGMRTHVGVAQKMFQTLSDKGINIQAISTSEIKISVVIASEYAELAIRALHAACALDVKPV